MEYIYTENEETMELKLKGKFTFTDNNTFLSFFEKNYNTIIIDLAEIDFIDSAALGVLLLTRDKCNKASIKLVLRNPVGQVQQMFKISKFNELFNIE